MIGNGDKVNRLTDGSLVLSMATGLTAGCDGETVRLNNLNDFPESTF
jgi:hypothetical protein